MNHPTRRRKEVPIQGQPSDDAMVTVVVHPQQLEDLRWTVLERLRSDVNWVADHVDEALAGRRPVSVADARSSGRGIRDTLALLDAIGWPQGGVPARQAVPYDERSDR